MQKKNVVHEGNEDRGTAKFSIKLSARIPSAVASEARARGSGREKKKRQQRRSIYKES